MAQHTGIFKDILEGSTDILNQMFGSKKSVLRKRKLAASKKTQVAVKLTDLNMVHLNAGRKLTFTVGNQEIHVQHNVLGLLAVQT